MCLCTAISWSRQNWNNVQICTDFYFRLCSIMYKFFLIPFPPLRGRDIPTSKLVATFLSILNCLFIVLENSTIGQLLSSKFEIHKLTQGKFLNYFVGIIFGNFSGIQNFISRKRKFSWNRVVDKCCWCM